MQRAKGPVKSQDLTGIDIVRPAKDFQSRRKTKLAGRSAVLLTITALASTVGYGWAAPINGALSTVAVPDVNWIGLLEGPGDWERITNPNYRTALRQLGKALFWDMQVGGDGVLACASCHYHAGGDNRHINQASPGLKAGDFVHDLFNGPNGTLAQTHYQANNQNGRQVGMRVSETALIAAGAVADALDGTPSPTAVKAAPALDINDVISSQGIRAGFFLGLAPDGFGGFGAVDRAALAPADPGFDRNFTANAPGIPDTTRRVEPRNSPTVINAVFNFRNFWDGRADTFFNGMNPLGFRDPDARVMTYQGSALTPIKLRVPFSSLASQAVGPVLSTFEMHYGPRTFPDVGKKLEGAIPLNGQAVNGTDDLLGTLRDPSGRGLQGTYGQYVRQIFDQKFWGDGNGNDVCVTDTAGGLQLRGGTGSCAGPLAPNDYTLLSWNFSLFFGLSVQAYEATLTTGQTIVDLVEGGVATGTLVNQVRNARKTVTVDGLALPDCIAALAINGSQAAIAVATDLCTAHYAKLIHPGAVAGAEAATATNGALLPGQAIGGCEDPLTCGSSPNLARARLAMTSIERGLNRFFAGATGCGICHFNPEFTGATVSALTGFGAPPPLPLPPGQARKIPPEVVLERMNAFAGGVLVYDSGFYNIGVRPTPEDISIGDAIGGVPLAYSKLVEIINGAPATGFDAGKIASISAEITGGELRIPTSPTDLTPIAWAPALVCAPGIQGNGNGNANNNPIPRCVPDVIPGERLQRFGSFKTPTLRNVKYTGPFFHNGAKMTLRQVLESYKTAMHFPVLNANNLSEAIRVFQLGVQDEAAVVEMMETGLTDWRVAYREGVFSHPELCVPLGHDAVTGKTVLAGIPGVGRGGDTRRLVTFEEQVRGLTAGRANSLNEACTVPGIVDVAGRSTIDVPPP